MKQSLSLRKNPRRGVGGAFVSVVSGVFDAVFVDDVVEDITCVDAEVVV